MDENPEDEIKLLLGGVIPERESEMSEYLNQYASHIARCDDRPGFIIEAGSFGILKFTQRTMDQMWILGFAANQALHSYSSMLAILRLHVGELDTNELEKIPDQSAEEEKYGRLINAVYELGQVNDTSEYTWPNEVPKPEDRKPTDIEGAATFDLICMSGAYVFLHEMKHIAFSQDNNAPSNPHDEEFECDSYAKSMMLDKLETYSKDSGYDLSRLYTKRSMSISLALFYMLVITPIEAWGGTESHPSIKARIESLVEGLPIPNDDILWLYMSSLFLSQLRLINKEHLKIRFSSLKELTMKLISEIEKASNN